MADNNLSVLIRIAAQDAATRVLNGLSSTVTKLGVAIAGAFAVKGISDFFGSAIRSAADVQKEFNNLAAKTGIAGDELAALKAKADALGASDALNVTAVQAAQAMTELGAAGQSTAQILASIEPVITLAQGAQLELADAAGIVTATLAQFGLEADQSARVTDVLSTGANSARTTVSQLAEALSYTGLAAKVSGTSLEETVAIIATMQQAGVEGSRAGTALNSMLLDLKNPASAASKALDEAGVSTRNLGEIIALAETKGASFRDAIALGFGKEAAPAFLAAVEAGSAKLNEFEGALTAASGSAKAAAATMNQGLSGAFDSLSSVWDGLKKSLGDKFLEPVEREVRALAAALSEFAGSPAFESLRVSFATVFTTAAANVREFLSRIDFTTAGNKIVEFATTATEALKTFAATAKTNIDAVWSVLTTTGALFAAASASFSGGVAVITAAFYGLGGVIDVVVAGIINGFAQLIDAQSRMTFGPLKTWLTNRVAELRSVADVFETTATDNFDKAGAAIDEAAARAADTRAAWATLRTELNRVPGSVSAATAAIQQYGDEQQQAAGKSAELIQAEKDLAAVTARYQEAMRGATDGQADASASIAILGAEMAAAKAKVDALTTAQTATATAAKTSANAQQDAAARTAQTATQTDALATAQQRASVAYRSYQAALQSGSADAGQLGRAWASAASQAQSLQAATQHTAAGVSAAGSSITSAAGSAQSLTSAYQSVNAASVAYNDAMATGADNVDELKAAWMAAEQSVRDLQAAQSDASQQASEDAAAWDAETKALVTYGEWVTKSGTAARQQSEDQRALATEVGLAGEAMRALSLAYAEALAKANSGAFPVDQVTDLGRQLETAKTRYADLKNELDQSIKPVEIPIETTGAETAQQEINALEAPTASQHTIETNAADALAEVNELDGADTSSTHTIYVERVERNAAGGLVGIARKLASGGPVFPVPTWTTVPGSGNADTVPAALKPGSFVLRKAATAYYGTTLLDLIHRFASGGSVPTLLTPGERVFRPVTVNRLGSGFFDALNRLAIPREDLAARLSGLMAPVHRFAAGGVVPGAGAGVAPIRDSVEINLKIGQRTVQMQGARDQAQALTTALRELQRGL